MQKVNGPVAGRAKYTINEVDVNEFKPCECGFGWFCWNDSSIRGFLGCFERPRWGFGAVEG